VWAAEVALGGSTGASLLHFVSRRTALLAGAEFALGHNESKSEIEGTTSESSFSNVTGRLGLRSYRDSGTERLRPVLGMGVRGSYAKLSTDVHSWNAGIYGELGAVYFVAPHLSLGGTGELQATYGKSQRAAITGMITETTSTTFAGSVARFLVSVYW
jgi:hypothetical protein